MVAKVFLVAALLVAVTLSEGRYHSKPHSMKTSDEQSDESRVYSWSRKVRNDNQNHDQLNAQSQEFLLNQNHKFTRYPPNFQQSEHWQENVNQRSSEENTYQPKSNWQLNQPVRASRQNFDTSISSEENQQTKYNSAYQGQSAKKSHFQESSESQESHEQQIGYQQPGKQYQNQYGLDQQGLQQQGYFKNQYYPQQSYLHSADQQQKQWDLDGSFEIRQGKASRVHHNSGEIGGRFVVNRQGNRGALVLPTDSNESAPDDYKNTIYRN